MKSVISGWGPGAIVAVDLWYGLVPVVHKGIATERGTVIHRSKRDGIAVEQSPAEFSGGRALRVIRPAPRDGLAVVARARREVGSEWRLLDANCEHLVAKATTGNPTSPQLWLAGLFVLLGVGVVAARA